MGGKIFIDKMLFVHREIEQDRNRNNKHNQTENQVQRAYVNHQSQN